MSLDSRTHTLYISARSTYDDAHINITAWKYISCTRMYKKRARVTIAGQEWKSTKQQVNRANSTALEHSKGKGNRKIRPGMPEMADILYNLIPYWYPCTFF